MRLRVCVLTPRHKKHLDSLAHRPPWTAHSLLHSAPGQTLTQAHMSVTNTAAPTCVSVCTLSYSMLISRS